MAAHLAVIDAEGQRELAFIMEGINAHFAFRRAGLLHTTPRHLLVAVLKALEEERHAALITARRRVQADLMLRRRWAKAGVVVTPV